MTTYLSTIKSLGFNAVWVNPFMKTSKYNMFLRQNKATGEKIRSVGSLYAMFDLSLIATEIYTETSTGDPSLPGSHDARPTLFMAKIAGDSTENLVLLAKKEWLLQLLHLMPVGIYLQEMKYCQILLRVLIGNSIDIFIVNINEINNFLPNELIFKYLKSCKAEIDAHKNIQYFNVY